MVTHGKSFAGLTIAWMELNCELILSTSLLSDSFFSLQNLIFSFFLFLYYFSKFDFISKLKSLFIVSDLLSEC